MLIRTMELTDIENIVKMEQILFTSPWSVSDFTYELTSNPFSRLFVLVEQEEIIGYIGYWLLGDQTQITTIGIAKEWQGKGYANYLMGTCISETKTRKYPRISLEVRVSNVSAISLYQKYGFTIVTVRKNYYQDTKEDAYLMVKEMEA